MSRYPADRLTSWPHRSLLACLALSTALAGLSMRGRALADDQWRDGCALIEGRLPEDCRHANAGTTVTTPIGVNTEGPVHPADLGDQGFAITIEAAKPVTAAAVADAATAEGRRDVDRILNAAGVNVTFDGLGVKPRLAIATKDLRTTARSGDTVTFRASTNYPAWIDRAEIRVMDRDRPDNLIAAIPVPPNGTAGWVIPADGPGDMLFRLRVYDARGRFNETRMLPLTRTSKAFQAEDTSGPLIAAGEGEDMTSRSRIPIRGGAVTVSGTGGGNLVTVMGEPVIPDQGGAYVIQRILPPGAHDVRIGVAGDDFTRRIDIPEKEWLYVGMADLTVGHNSAGTYSLGRLAGYAKGHTAGGYTITASADTREGDLEGLFSDLGQKDPDKLLRRVTGDDVYPTFGDNSTTEEGAPTSGKFYLRVEKDKSHLSWGDFKPERSTTELIRSDRTLYGASLAYESPAQTTFGEPRARVTAYGAQPDRLAQRDILRGTGGSAYFLSRQDILTGTETIFVEYRDSVSGHVIRREPLVNGNDYEIDYFQGVIIMKRPVNPTGGGSFLSGGTSGRYDVSLVAQYEYAPATGQVDGYALGSRAEVWLNDRVRLGLSAADDTSGVADSRARGGDVLLRRSDNTYLSFEYAQSEGPAPGTALSYNGGLDLLGATSMSAGTKGHPAEAYRLDAKADLAELTGKALSGTVAAYFDHKEAGFASAGYDVADTQDSWGLSAEVDLGPVDRLSFALDAMQSDSGEAKRDARLTYGHDLNDQWTAELGLIDISRRFAGTTLGPTGLNGRRTDAGAKLTWSPSEDLSLWTFGQATLDRTGQLPANNRLGFGGTIQLTDRLAFEGEVSGGSLGAGGAAVLKWDNGKGKSYHAGYRLDPGRGYEDTPFTGEDGGTWVLGATAKVSDKITYTADNTYDLKGDAQSVTNAYGVRYSPNDKWSFDGNVNFGQAGVAQYGTITRQAFGLGFGYEDGELAKAGLRGEYRREGDTTGKLDRNTWLLSGYTNWSVSDDWRFVGDLDALISESDQSAFRDGRYIETNLGYAYRPADNNRLTALFRYTYLYDLPGADQVNFDGKINGPSQKSHILSFDVNYDLTERWTIGAKYGYRVGETAARGTNNFVASAADLAVLRLDYSVALNWDVMAEGRISRERDAGLREQALLLGAYRSLGNHMKVGVGYQWGQATDDLRSLDGKDGGPFLNITAKF